MISRAPAGDFVGPPSPFPKAFVGPPSPFAKAQAPTTAEDSDIDPRLAGITGKGKGEKLAQTLDTNSKDLTSNRTAVDRSEFQKAYDAITGMPEYQDQQKTIDDLSEKARQSLGAPDTNQAWLKPLIALTDSVTGSDLMKGYTPGMTPYQRNQLLLKYADELAKRKEDLTKEARQGAVGLLSGTQLQQMIEANKLTQQAATTGGFAPTGQFMRQTEREGRHLVQEGEILNNVIKLLSQGNPSANPTIKTALARYIEGTVRPQLAVIGQEGGDPSIVQGILNRVETLSSGHLTDEQVGQYKKELQAFLQSHNDNVSAFERRARVMNSQLPSPLAESDFQSALSPYTHPHGNQNAVLNVLPDAKNIHPPRKTKSSSLSLPSLDEIDAELARRKGGK
jgi:hypothetical protein